MTTTTNTTNTAGRPWSPTTRDRLIYQWVKFDGHKQSWVADQLNLNQSTVSRIVDRYERWIARGGLTQQGAPSRDERLRAQRWLTYERNEWILASCMRLSGEMERSMDTSKSTILHHANDPSRELEVRTEHKTLQRSGTACRFLRLAHRVNMDQEKLLAKLDLPALEPLTLDPNEQSQALADAREGFQQQTPFEKVVPSCHEGQEAKETFHSPAPQPASVAAEPSVHSPTPHASPLTQNPPTTSAEMPPWQNKKQHAYAVASTPPKPTNPLDEILNLPHPNSPPPILLSLPFQMPLTS